ncbi:MULTISPECIES: metal ABC transporter substrate-binding protein [Pantoea]|jgi:zinc/manganese transport system substrate-binding protein|uniref:Metal ABC transporter substrate-binding protein n=1 Tax=Pantoea anthophila TaxID=470931 RepID=A0ABY2ZA32_9GAMM|nr:MULTISPECIES: metal ABC transporter substrate-binding protein [Pantoea]KAF6662142.1 metal ABC transporter substrate-binding protein [Enterobacteriaceae bacterium EKM102V]TPE18639.1 metal ABC transporter substrate-binding protein [Pantoea vagans]EIB99680.1 metal ABC transporter substrate-binding protein [Pantoea sp. Sc1]KAF6664476.1 metal ABC transporter substrate-binding protein [Pantoea sp. EKM101V]KAF6670609.1 metal ABC transporter substrate-binding protein [Pantoea sp. EKM103V]
MKKLPVSLALAALFATPLAMAKTVDVVASFTVLADIVSQVGGDHVKVKSLVGPDGDPHTFEPTPQDSQALAKADLVFVSGLGLEGWMDRLVSASGYHGQPVVASAGVTTRSMEEEGKTITDPHAWNSMQNGVIYATNVMNALVKADPEDAAAIRQRGQNYIQQLQALDSWAKTAFDKIPVEKRKVLTSHDAFGYFGQRYGVTFLAPVGFSTEAEASASNVGDLITQLKQQHITRYFIENQTDPRLVKQIASATGAEPGGELYPEALSPASGPAPTYQAAFKHNVNAMLKSMQ